jgi:type III pantothenate kinase
MKYIIGDIGNTLTKICLIDNNFKISKEFSIESKKLLKKNNVIKFLDPILKQTIKINIDNYRQLGSDRIANAIGAYYSFKQSSLIIDFGTATTFDIVKSPGIYEGGVITPGLKLSIINLNKFTAALPIFKLKSNAKVYGKNTKDALNAGFLWGYQGLINNIIKKLSIKFKTNFKIILTGGYAKIFSKFIDKKTTIDRHITIKGIMHIHKKLIK